ncbi:tetratricopeptide repeat protein [Sphingomonas sp.]|uniref:tetratricopeptide repeat protein n=1 Tax=Sphingomonas sp. TaxID=28214 RepID=UPI002DD682A5|nr:tetratricopeptide repeat protein [Sphingomonas sp.]
MAKIGMVLGAVTACLCGATPAMANGGAVRTAHDAIVRGDFTSAEQTLAAERRIFPARPEVTINLAAVYARTGRADLATSLYRDALSRDAVMLDLGDARPVSSHVIAQRGLSRIAAIQTAAR